jgi:hypothetical protein
MSAEFLMKGKVFSEHSHKLTYPVIAEVKYDEIRLHVRAVFNDSYRVTGVEFLSYAGKPLYNLDRWAGAFADFMHAQGLYDLDLGLEVNGNFNDSYRWSRSKSGIPKEKLDKKTGKVAPELFASMVRFVLFDIPQFQDEFSIRRGKLGHECWIARERYALPMDRPQSWVIDSEAALLRKFIEVREAGHEGLMVKTLEHKYIAGVGKRIDGWLKLKPDMDCDGVITKVNQAISIEGVPLPRAGSVDLLMPDGSTASPHGINHTLGALMFMHPEEYVGQWCEFSCMERDRKGGYRHPVFKRLREAK